MKPTESMVQAETRQEPVHGQDYTVTIQKVHSLSSTMIFIQKIYKLPEVL